MHIGPSNKAMVTLLQLLCPENEERGKTTWGKSSLKKGHNTEITKMSSLCVFIHLNEMIKLLLNEIIGQ